MGRKRLDELMTWDELATKVVEESKPKNKKGMRAWFLSKKQVGYCFDSLMWKHCYGINQKLKKDYDHFTVICGKEGLGKSMLGLPYASSISKDFKLKNICFKFEDFVKNIKDSSAGDTIILDEGALFLFSYQATSAESVLAKKLFTIMRAKNLHVVICIPNFFTIDRYVRDHRVDTLIYVTSRGNYRAYVGKAIKILSKVGEKFKSFSGVKVPYGTFWDGHYNLMKEYNDINEESYKLHKMDNVDEYIDELLQKFGEKNIKNFKTTKEVSDQWKVDTKTVKRWVEKGTLKGLKLGGRWLVDPKSIPDAIKAQYD